MIRVDREQSLEDGSRVQPSSKWFGRAERATKQAAAEGPDHQVDDALYRHSEVRMALEKLFHDKCAYCEGRPGSTGPWDVEHYRPKGRVAERPDHSGYYWLAYTWTNLYPACVYCNQRRRDAPLWDDRATLPASGKSYQFPLEDEDVRAMSPGDDPSHERPLLIDPCGDDPESHLTYDVQGRIQPRRPDDQRARTTIRVCHLDRRRLEKPRARIISRVRDTLRTLDLARKTGNSEVLAYLERELAHYLADDALHAGVARAVVRDPDPFTPSSA